MNDLAGKAKAIFLDAIEHYAPEQWAFYLDEACAGDGSLRARVDKLLRARAQLGSFHEACEPSLVATADGQPVSEGPGTIIGPYKLLEQIGEGGMGLVFVAEQQQPIKRRVALKIIKPGMDSRQVIARFEAERQALALMDHPNIATVHDGGTTPEGRPYFVMELVKGAPITAYCDTQRLSTHQRLELFLNVCHAVQHAHHKGIIHRDLKPSNVLVSRHDTVPVVKVIDFGIAKAISGQLTEKTVYTALAQMVGTPLYMSPEQAGLSDIDVDTRSDVYSLGVLLYELLTGMTPFDSETLKKASYDELRRIIREDEPPRPSTRLSTIEQAARSTIAERRGLEPHRLSLQLRGELDWIAMKALEKDRSRRYESASALAADVQRYLHDEPVQACPPSALYRFRKFARRNKAAMMTAAAITITVLMVGAVSSGLIWRANRELRQTLYFQSIALAEREWSANNLSGMERLLDACPTDLRGWEWNYLRRLRYKRLPLMEHAQAVLSVTVSPDGEWVASCSQDGIIKIWDAKTGQELRCIPAHKNHVRSIAFSPDGQSLASGSWDGTVKLWDAHTGQERHALTGHHVKVWGLAFSPDGKLLASAGGGGQGNLGELKLWNPITGQEVRSFPGYTSTVYCVAFSPDGTRLASGSAGPDKTIKLWDVETGQKLLDLPGHHCDVMGVAFSPDGRLLASCAAAVLSSGGELKVWDATTGRLLHDLRKHTHGVWGVAFSPDGHRLASGSFDQTVKIWDMASGQEALTMRDHVGPVRGVMFSPDGHRLFSGGEDGTVRVWDATPLGHQEDEDCLTLRGHGDEVTSVAFHPQNSAVVASASTDGTIQLWNTWTAKTFCNMRDPGGSVMSLAFSPDGHLLATVGADKGVKIWDTQSGNLLNTLCGDQQSGDVSVVFLPNGRRIASGGWDTVVRIWDLETRKRIHTLADHTWAIWGLAASPDGRHLASASLDGTVRLWDVESGKEAVPLPSPKRAHGWCVAFSHDGRQLAWSCMDRSVKVWDTSTWKLLHSLPDTTGVPRSLAFSPDGRFLAWGGTDATVKLWQAATGDIHVLHGHANWVHGVAFSPDCKQIASASADGTVKIWPCASMSQGGDQAAGGLGD